MSDADALMALALPMIAVCWYATNKAMDTNTEGKAKVAMALGVFGLVVLGGISQVCEGRKTGMCQFGL